MLTMLSSQENNFDFVRTIQITYSPKRCDELPPLLSDANFPPNASDEEMFVPRPICPNLSKCV
jgi:hypothetical protein